MIKYNYILLFVFAFIFISESLYAANKGGRNLPSRRPLQKPVAPNEQIRNLGPTRPTEGVRESLEDFSRQTPSADLDVATEPGLTKLQMKLIRDPDYNIIDAVFENEIEIVRSLIIKGRANINLRDELGRTPLMIAAASQDIEMAQFLLQAGTLADAKALDNENRTALHYTHNSDLARALVQEFKLDVNARDNEGRVPLHYVQNIELARVFVLELGSDANAKDTNGHRPPLTRVDTEIMNFLKPAGRFQHFINNPTGNRQIKDNETVTIADWLNNVRARGQDQKHPIINHGGFINWLNQHGIDTYKDLDTGSFFLNE